MIRLGRSDTGSYVLVHEPSSTLIVGDDLATAYARMEATLREHSPEAIESAPPAPDRARPWLLGLGLLALLPFVWLGVLHYTLGGLIEQVANPGSDKEVHVPKEVQALTAEVHQLEQTVERLQTELGQRRDGPPSAAPRVGRPRRPVEHRGAGGQPANVRDRAPETPVADDPEATDDAEEPTEAEASTGEEPSAEGDP